ncbi:hypothetical protein CAUPRSCDRAFT_12992 [Caulochytrium protostelioides]|uniref:Uncharacterized protein n=1 Tax=Caulochytrium protostelioides TaxID=1555241 RepID=A0A4P9WQ70_9FUNG|nr:hypothetical protein CAUPRSCDRAFT_12992 [Caulochytrium protostelioides]
MAAFWLFLKFFVLKGIDYVPAKASTDKDNFVANRLKRYPVLEELEKVYREQLIKAIRDSWTTNPPRGSHEHGKPETDDHDLYAMIGRFVAASENGDTVANRIKKILPKFQAPPMPSSDVDKEIEDMLLPCEDG